MASESDAEAELRAKYKDKKTAQDEKWRHEIELLENRITSNIKDISIGNNGGTIAIRASLSDAEMNTIAQLEQKRSKLGTKNKEGNTILAKDETDKADEIAWEILAMVTANPHFTKDWFANNRDKYSTEDMMTVTLGFYDSMATRMQRVSEIKQFRQK